MQIGKPETAETASGSLTDRARCGGDGQSDARNAASPGLGHRARILASQRALLFQTDADRRRPFSDSASRSGIR